MDSNNKTIDITPPAASSPVQAGKPSANSQRNRLIAVVLVLVIVVVGIIVIVTHKSKNNTTGAKLPAPAMVSITADGYVPATININEGQTVVWVNKVSATHEINSDPYPKDDGLIAFNDKTPLTKNSSWSFKFTKAGTYPYHDNLYPYSFKGTVVVE